MESTLASQLRSAREERGLSLADAAHATRIPIPRLTQLEDGNLAAFGSMAYARSFIRSYSQFLGVDASKFVKELPEPIFGGPQDYRYLTDSFGPWIDHRLQKSRHSQRDPSSASARGVYALVLFIVLGICSAVLAHNFLFPKTLPDPNSKPATVAHAPVTLSQAQPVQTGSNARVSFVSPPMPPRFVSFAKQASEEIRQPDASSLPIVRAMPVQDESQTPGNAQ